jgi:SulP family sulfate permease
MKNLFSNFRGDLFGGLTAGIVALPLALAFGVSSGLGPDAGLYGAILISFFAALFGGTPTQISGPTAPMTAVSMVIIAGIIATNDGDVNKALPSILLVFLLAGLIQIVLGFTGIGKYIRYIPYPVVSGFMTAIGVIIIITQLAPSFGYDAKKDTDFVDEYRTEAKAVILKKLLDKEVKKDTLSLVHFQAATEKGAKITEDDITKEAKTLAAKEASGVLGTFKVLPRIIRNVNWLELGLALMTIFIIFGFKRITTKIPSTLVALVVVTGGAVALKLDYNPIREIPSGLPMPNLEMFQTFSLDAISPYIFTAIALAFLGAIDSLLTSVVADNMTKTKHKPNQELIGQGIGNSIASIFGGIPGAGATIRTVVNINAGGKTKLSGMIAGVVLLIIMLGFSSVASKIPAAVLAGILVTVGIGVMDYKGLRAIPSMPKDIQMKLFKVIPIKLSSDVMIMLVVLVLSSIWDLVNAVGIGLVIASLIFMKRIGDLTGTRSDVKPLTEERWVDEVGLTRELKEKVFIKHIKGPLFFGSTSDFQQLVKQIPQLATMVVIRMDRMQYIDQSGLYTLEDILVDLKKEGKIILFVDVQSQPRYMMERIDMIPDLIGEETIFDDFNACMQWMKQHKDV